MKTNVEGKEEDQNKRCLVTIENDLRTVDVCVRDIGNRDEWNFGSRVADPN